MRNNKSRNTATTTSMGNKKKGVVEFKYRLGKNQRVESGILGPNQVKGKGSAKPVAYRYVSGSKKTDWKPMNQYKTKPDVAKEKMRKKTK